MKRYGLKGINDEATECMVCGRVELKRVMWLVELDADGNEGEAFHVGTSCGAKLMGYPLGRVTAVVNNFASKVTLRRQDLLNKKLDELGRSAILEELHRLKLPTFKDRLAHPLYAKLREIDAEAKAWVEAQPIVIEI